MPRFFDVSMELAEDIPIWPGSRGFRMFRTMSIGDGDPANVSLIEMDVHAGTHIESSLHFLEDGEPLEALPLDRFVGPAQVVTIDGPDVTADALDGCDIPEDTTRLLLKTRNSAMADLTHGAFEPAYAGLTAEAARWIIDRAISLVGIDYLSVQRFSDGPETHRILMRAGVAILEGLDLRAVEAGRYTLVCLPLRLGVAEAAPARVILVDDDGLSWA